MIKIDDILVEGEILNTNFACDLKKCKGACCTFPGEYGAPLKKEELPLIEDNLESAFEYLSEESIDIIKNEGFYEIKDGNLATRCIDGKDCVFVTYDGDVAKCSLEKAFYDKKSDFKKPISCHLFPIRVGDYAGKYLYFDKFKECEPAFEKGESEGIHLSESVKEALEREFGTDWTQKFIDLAKK